MLQNIFHMFSLVWPREVRFTVGLVKLIKTQVVFSTLVIIRSFFLATSSPQLVVSATCYWKDGILSFRALVKEVSLRQYSSTKKNACRYRFPDIELRIVVAASVHRRSVEWRHVYDVITPMTYLRTSLVWGDRRRNRQRSLSMQPMQSLRKNFVRSLKKEDKMCTDGLTKLLCDGAISNRFKSSVTPCNSVISRNTTNYSRTTY